MTLEQDQTDYYWNLLMVSVWEPLSIQKFELLNKNHQIKPEIQGKAMEWNAVTHSAKSHHGTDSKNFSHRVRGLQLPKQSKRKIWTSYWVAEWMCATVQSSPGQPDRNPNNQNQTHARIIWDGEKTFPVDKQTTMARDSIWYPVVVLDIYFQERRIKIQTGRCQEMLLGKWKVYSMRWNCKNLTYLVLGGNMIYFWKEKGCFQYHNNPKASPLSRSWFHLWFTNLI